MQCTSLVFPYVVFGYFSFLLIMFDTCANVSFFNKIMYFLIVTLFISLVSFQVLTCIHTSYMNALTHLPKNLISCSTMNGGHRFMPLVLRLHPTMENESLALML